MHFARAKRIHERGICAKFSIGPAAMDRGFRPYLKLTGEADQKADGSRALKS
jgi:hypothetical protein